MSQNPYDAPHTEATSASPDMPADQGDFKDRSLGLMLYGLLQIIMGALSALLVPFMLLSMTMAPPAAGMTTRSMVPALLMYGILAVVLVWLGVGSFLARRWARALTLVLAWLWLICGAVGMIAWGFMMPSFYRQMTQQQAGLPGSTLTMILLVMGGMVMCIYVFLPLAFVVFYQSRHVKATCELKDPTIRWTDRCPLSVLGLCVLMVWGLFATATTPFNNFIIPLFGTILTGWPGAVVWLVNGALFLYLLRGLYQLKPTAWWITFAWVLLWSLSSTITFATNDLITVYRRMNMPPEQLKVIEQMGVTTRPVMMIFIVGGASCFVGYLLYVRRYFCRQPQAD